MGGLDAFFAPPVYFRTTMPTHSPCVLACTMLLPPVPSVSTPDPTTHEQHPALKPSEPRLPVFYRTDEACHRIDQAETQAFPTLHVARAYIRSRPRPLTLSSSLVSRTFLELSRIGRGMLFLEIWRYTAPPDKCCCVHRRKALIRHKTEVCFLRSTSQALC